METVVLHELRSWIEIGRRGGELFYWKTPSGAEVHFVWVRGGKHVGIAVKAAQRWQPEFSRVLRELHDGGLLTKCFGVYCGRDRLQDGPILVLPLKEFMRELAAGGVLS